MGKKKRKNLHKSTARSQKVNPVEKSQQNVQNSVKNVDKSPKTSGKPVQKTPTTVQNPTESCGNHVDNHVQNSDNSVENSPQPVHNSSKTVENPVDKLVDNSIELHNTSTAANTTPHNHHKKPVITVTNLHKSFRLPTERASGLKQAILNWFKGIKGYTEHQVLRGINLTIREGEFVGIVGRNGSGKSTLLKLLAQIYYPEQGTICVDGTLVPFIELGVGFNPELTGRENVFLNGALLGFSRKEMESMYDEIVRFAELETFMDAKLKNYSSGMQVRLAFSIAIRARGDILILDEVLAVGDAEFQKKCNDYFASLHGQQTVILVTHSMENVRRFCDRAILIENGEILTEGDPETVAKAYEKLWE